ncbi:type II toxin-antitoxin system VapC family toxin [Pseudomonas sp. 14P_8.1_Bac3]|uniref:type II toxin-antitoxin system VapC family toxin n=1 Tax=Pseudomonas sp. 14P_8.1_Bac3 TaxID=2971621 RepID=UPI0021C6F728|nr:type II toxin-antitoxin system VapC family toxin [Pseudomonas sp. 14P_8.1_Bac3]MCU1759900.1 type II toxin-antitoxin system VapC family toxin [Pseudomonas sp. 14P_8.1_Bac3]
MDTHAFLWWLSDNPSLGAEARLLIGEPRNQVLVSAASIWEISIKQAKGMLEVPEDLEALVEDEGFTKLPISLFHGQQAGKLPEIHRDPFDRMLIAQAQAEGLELVTADGIIPRYGIRVVSARS